MSDPVRVLITGGAGFLGQRLVGELRDRAETLGRPLRIRVFDVVEAPRADESQVGDVRDREALLRACRGIDVVVHSASVIDWGNGTREEIFSVNVDGTRNVIEAARRQRVRALLYTSTMDCVMDGRPHLGVDESLPYPARFMDRYAESKARAEREVLAAHGSSGGEGAADHRLVTAALRPCGMYGEADPYHMDHVLGNARAGRLVLRLGSPDTVFQHVYVGNVAYAHALAVFELLEPEPRIAGRTYFVTDREADNFFEFMRPFVEHDGHAMPPPSRTLPTWLAMGVGTLGEALARRLAPIWKFQPALTRSSVSVLTTSFSVSGARLAEDLDYAPRYSETEAARRVMDYYDRQRE